MTKRYSRSAPALALILVLQQAHALDVHGIRIGDPWDPEKLEQRFSTANRDGYNSHMEKATVSKLKDNLSAYLRKVRAGHAVVIYDRDVPIARLERIESSGRGSDRLALLLAQGVTRPPLRALTASKVRAMLPKPIDRSVRLLDALELDRTDDR